MRHLLTATVMFLSLGIYLLTSLGELEGGNISLPKDYKDWHHVKSMVINEGHLLFDPFGGIHHIYANEEAIKGYKSGTFLQGSILVFDLYASINKGNAIVEGSREFIGVMEKNANAYNTTDGWIYEVFAGEALEPKGVNYVKDCHGCHTAVKNRDYIFSMLRE